MDVRWEERAQQGGLPAFPAVTRASTAGSSRLWVQGGASVLCPCSCCRRGHPLAGWLNEGTSRLSGTATFWEEEKQAVYHRGPQGCISSQVVGTSEAPESSQPADLSMQGRFCPPALSPEQRALCNLSPFNAPLAAGKSFKLPACLLPQWGRLCKSVLHKQLESQPL